MTDWAYRLFGCGTNDPNEYCEYVRKAKEKLATEVVPRNFRVEISEGQYRQTSYAFQYAHKKLVYEGYGHTIPTFSYSLWRRGVSSFGGEAYLTMHETCPKEPTLEMFYDLCLELDVVRSQIEELVKDKVDQLPVELAELDELSEVDELRAELAELKSKQRPKGRFGLFHKQS